MTAFIASVRMKSTGEVFYRLKGHISMWTSDRSRASHFPTRDEAERSIYQVSSKKYDKFVGTAREVSDLLDGVKFIAAVRNRNTGVVRFRVAATYPHTGPGEVWSDKIALAHRFESEEAAESVLRLMSDAVFDKKIGTPSQVKFWASQVDMKKLQDQVNASVKKIADCTLTPAIFISQEQARSMILGQDFDIKFDEVETPEADHTSGSNDLTSLDVIETYIEKAQKIEEEGADEFTWRGFLHAFLKDVTEVSK